MDDEIDRNSKQLKDFNVHEEDVLKAAQKYLNSTNIEILSYSFKSLQESIGLLGDHSYLDVTVKESNNADKVSVIKLFVKFFPKVATQATFAEGIGAFKKESFVYELFELFKKDNINLISECTPTCYVIRPNEYIILENLITSGYKENNKKEYLSYNELLIALEYLARLHASSLIYEEQNSVQLINEFDNELEESFFNDQEDFIARPTINASFKCILKEIEIFDIKLNNGKPFKTIAEALCRKMYELVKPSQKFRNVLCHGDLWATNFLLKFKNQCPFKCKFVDFQCGRYTPPAHDVLGLIFLTTSREFRKKHLYELLGVYYNILEKNFKIGTNSQRELNTVLSFEEFLISCDEQKIFAILQAATYFPLILIDNKDLDELFTDPELNQKALFEDKSHLVLARLGKDECYEKRLRESIEDLRDICEYFKV